jgi:hypothetical protein
LTGAARRLGAIGQALGCFTLLLLGVFRPVLFHDGQFAFQDAGHYYYPLLERVQQEWNAGRWPLWAPELNAGTPLLGDPTAAVLYPGKLFFFLLPHPWAVRVFVIGHVALAWGGMRALLRGWHVSTAGSLIGALAYSFGVPVLSQTSNMIFLVGAAWAPLGFLAADRWLRGGVRLALAVLAGVLAMQVLGGDPEAAYLLLICAGGYAVGLAAAQRATALRRWFWAAGAGLIAAYLALLALAWWSARTRRAMDPWVTAAWGTALALLTWQSWRRWRTTGRESRELARGVTGLIGAAALALAVSGAQLLPVIEYSGMSFRAAAAEGYHDMYAYSAHPLQFLDAVWPNVFGTVEGGYRSWLNALPPKPGSRLWMPSVYLGGLTLVLAAAAAGVRGGPPWRAWLTVVGAVSLLGALGYHASPLLWARLVPGGAGVLGPIEPPFAWQVRSDGYLRDGDGGVYWFLASPFPGFRSFRYPPKLLVVWSLAVSGLAGAGWDRLVAGRTRRAVTVAGGLLAATLIVLLASWIGAGPLRAGFDRLAAPLRSSDEPIDVARAVADLRRGIAHGAVVMALAIAIVGMAPRRPGLTGWIAALGLVLDLGTANAYHVLTAPQLAFEGEPLALEVIRRAEATDPSLGPYRVQRVGRWWPEEWAKSGAPRRFDEIVRWERMTVRPNYGLPLGVESTFYFDTLAPLDYGLFFLPWSITPAAATARDLGLRPGQQVWYYPRRGFDLWNTRYFIVPGRLVWESEVRGYGSVVPQTRFLYPRPGAFEGKDGAARRARWLATEDFRVLRNEASFPRAWVVHRAYLVPPVRGLRIADRAEQNARMLYQGDALWNEPGFPVRDLRSVAWVETDRPRELDRRLSRAEPDPAEIVTVTPRGPQSVEVTAVLHSAGLVVVADLYYPGWELTVDGRPAEILRTNRAMRGVVLPAGTHRLVFGYNPLSFRAGMALSAAGIASLAGLIAWAIRGWEFGNSTILAQRDRDGQEYR